MKFRLSQTTVALAAYAAAALLSVAAASWAAIVIENRSSSAVRIALVDAGFTWATVQADGLQVVLTGTAPSEAQRFRAISTASTVVDPERVIDGMEVAASGDIKTPEFSVEVMRNEDGISLIGLVPTGTDRPAILEDLAAITEGGSVTDLLDAADHPVPPTWQAALDFGLDAIRLLPRSKVSVASDRVSITAIANDAAEKAKLEAELRRTAPKDVALLLDISAPRPVIAPFTLRFLIDADGPRFDACSADNDKARVDILAAATAAGASGDLTCTIGLGVPSPEWSKAVGMAIQALATLGEGSVTFKDADISLVAGPSVTQAAFDAAVGQLESNLPEVFALDAVLTKAEGANQAGAAEFVATLAEDGRVSLGGRINDKLTRTAVENLARVSFGGDSVSTALREDIGLPVGWPIRVLAGLQALAEIDQGTLTVTADEIRIEGRSGSRDAASAVTRRLTSELGGTEGLKIKVAYDAKLDPLAALPTPEECVNRLNAILTEKKITFEPGSANIAPEARDTLDKLAEALKSCPDVPMEVGGHTDSQGREEMNLNLSQNRAQAVINAMMDRRILVGNLTAHGYGETVPIGDNETEAGREANRRIEIRLIAATTQAAAEGTQGTDAAAPDVTVAVETPGEDTIKPKARPNR